MSYHSTLPVFPTNIIVAQSQQWYSPKALNQILSALSQVYFPVCESRSTALEAINSLITDAPFSYIPPNRFPSPGIYLSSLDPVLTRLLSQLNSALSYKDRLIEKTNIGNTTVSTTSNTPQYLQSLNSFVSSRLLLSQYVADYNNYTDRSVFENQYQITWS
jgi:hypothetical protein